MKSLFLAQVAGGSKSHECCDSMLANMLKLMAQVNLKYLIFSLSWCHCVEERSSGYFFS